MTVRQRYRPFTGDTEKKILLKDAPLALVLCQIQWPGLTHLQGDLDSVARKFGFELNNYPICLQVPGAIHTFTAEGYNQQIGEKLYQWHSLDENWHVILGHTFLTLYCTKYSQFTEFLNEFKTVTKALENQLKIPIIRRIGIRYVNQISDTRLIDNLEDYLKPEVLGYSKLLGQSNDIKLISSANQVRYQIKDAVLEARSGYVPAKATPDPAINPLETVSWVLDLDASIERDILFNIDVINEEASRLADISYDFFKYISTDGFLKEFGGN